MVWPRISQINTDGACGDRSACVSVAIILKSPTMGKLIQESETYKIIGLCMEIHRILGFGFSEIVYKDALEMEASVNQVPFNREKQFPVIYKGAELRHKYYADFVMFEDIIVEIKASADGIADEHISQTLNYMKASDCRIGLIINFGKKSLEHKRLVF